MLGKHLIIDIHNIINSDVLKYIKDIKPLLKLIIDNTDLNVVGELIYQFYPCDATVMYLLAESHLSIHTYPELNYCAIDLYSCNNKFNAETIIEIISNFFNDNCWITKHLIER